MLYTKNGSYPAPLPRRIRLSDGTTRTDSSTFTDEEISDAGYVAVDNPPTATHPNRVEWTGSEWQVREPNFTETTIKRREIKQACLNELVETDYKVIKAVELGEELDPIYVTYRQKLRDLYNSVDSADPWSVVMPTPEEESSPE